jgi:hypothetical protein
MPLTQEDNALLQRRPACLHSTGVDRRFLADLLHSVCNPIELQASVNDLAQILPLAAPGPVVVSSMGRGRVQNLALGMAVISLEPELRNHWYEWSCLLSGTVLVYPRL